MTYFEMGGLEMYVQKDESRYEATMQAIKWISDNGFLWTTKGRGASPRYRPWRGLTTRRPAIPGRCAAPSSTA